MAIATIVKQQWERKHDDIELTLPQFIVGQSVEITDPNNFYCGRSAKVVQVIDSAYNGTVCLRVRVKTTDNGHVSFVVGLDGVL